jgi:hypothetical protein
MFHRIYFGKLFSDILDISLQQIPGALGIISFAIVGGCAYFRD